MLLVFLTPILESNNNKHAARAAPRIYIVTKPWINIMTTTFLDIPQQAATRTCLLGDDSDIEPHYEPSLLQQLSTRWNDFRQKLPWTTPACSDILSPACLISWHHLREAVVVADGNKLHVYVFPPRNRPQNIETCVGGGRWLSPIATPARPVKSVSWSPLSNTLIVGSNDGVYLWRLPSLDDEGVKSSSFTHLPASALSESLLERARDLLRPLSALSRAADILEVSPQGRLFCAVLSPASEQRRLGQHLQVWDMYSLTGGALPCSVGGLSSTLLSAATLGLVPLPSLCITCLQWSPSGQFLAVGCSNGTVVLVDAGTWEQTPVCRLDGGGVQQLCWVSTVDCMMLQQAGLPGGGEEEAARGGLVYSLHVPDAGLIDRDRDPALDTSAIHDTQLSTLPVNLIDSRLRSLMLTFCLDKNLIDDPGGAGGAFHVADIASDDKCDYIAAAFGYSHACPGKCFRLPFVGLYLCSTRPHFSATFLSIIDNQSSSNDGIEGLIWPVEIRFNRSFCQGAAVPVHMTGAEAAAAQQVQVAVRWSNKVVSFSPCHVCTNKAAGW